MLTPGTARKVVTGQAPIYFLWDGSHYIYCHCGCSYILYIFNVSLVRGSCAKLFMGNPIITVFAPEPKQG